MPLHDWSQEDGHLIAHPGSFGGIWRGPNGNTLARLYKSTATIAEKGPFVFAKANTNVSTNLRRSRFDFDCNGWPQSARNSALRTLGRDTIIAPKNLR
jgi:hypothetical protein